MAVAREWERELPCDRHRRLGFVADVSLNEASHVQRDPVCGLGRP
jgi:hypothetical protein